MLLYCSVLAVAVSSTLGTLQRDNFKHLLYRHQGKSVVMALYYALSTIFSHCVFMIPVKGLSLLLCDLRTDRQPVLGLKGWQFWLTATLLLLLLLVNLFEITMNSLFHHNDPSPRSGISR